MNASPLGREWDRQFGFLNNEEMQFGGDMHHAYLTLLALATSARDLERLHQYFPENCQLLRDDLNALKKFWRAQCDRSQSCVGVRLLSDDSVKRILAMQCDRKSLCEYYVDRLLANRESSHFPDDESTYWNNRTSVPLWGKKKDSTSEEEYGYFEMRVHGITCGGWCALSQDREKLLVRIEVPSRALTATNTYQLLSIPKTPWWSRSPDEVPFCLMAPAAPFLELIGSTPLLPFAEQAEYITAEMLAQDGYVAYVRDGFCGQLKHSLIAIGVPVEIVGRTDTRIERRARRGQKRFNI